MWNMYGIFIIKILPVTKKQNKTKQQQQKTMMMPVMYAVTSNFDGVQVWFYSYC